MSDEGEVGTPKPLDASWDQPSSERYVLRLFIAGSSPSSAQAVDRIHLICQEHLEGRYDLEIVDIHQQPERASADDVFAIPTLLKELPVPLRRIIGDLSDEGRVLIALGIGPKR